MQNNCIGNRVIQVRNHFGLKQGELSEEIGMDQGNVSKVERNLLEPSNRFLNALMLRFAVNPDWIKTGQGNMLIAPEEYIAKGITLLGSRKMSEGFLSILKDPRYSDFQSYIAMDDVIKENISDDLKGLLQQVITLWQRGDETINRTLVQFVGAFPENSEEKMK
jgi:transcriptional regulator with XRE-family HTH domain